MAAAANIDTVVYALNDVWVTHTEETDSFFTKVNFHVRFACPTFTAFFNKIKPAFLWWGREHGFDYLQSLTHAELVLRTDTGTRTCLVATHLLATYDWENNWTVLKTELSLEMDDIFWIYAREKYSTLHLMGMRHPPQSTSPPMLADTSSLSTGRNQPVAVVQPFQPLTQSNEDRI